MIAGAMDIDVTRQAGLPAAAVAAVAPVARAARPRAGRRVLYPVLSALLIGLVATGFWPSYFGRLLGGTFRAHWIVHLHGAVFAGWMVLLFAQVLLVSTGRTRLHRRLGAAGVGYAALVLGTGLTMSLFAPVMHVRSGEWTADRAAAFMLLPLGDMVLFAGFFGAAIAYRRRPNVHKRLMVAATVAIAFAAAGRMFEASIPGLYLVWLSPLLVAIAYELAVERRVHPAWLISLAVLGAAGLRILAMDSEPWLGAARVLLSRFL
jgi:hypothetical protein